ncbi:hypothetical protein GJ631_10750 [Natronomonas sp. CBA1123]|uniref:hypothetical protein n=1 Tax=Natronomonas sp. CBA1123 TaxID=2668070 RepID=UPI0012E9BA34|nr:hypothetical protein [Natronomonas sp. CBA1123]MUV87033.1 hypothetical protein [Natronomonas sp. CBA1123]
MFLLAFAVILISMNQAYVVPQENSEIEFQHFQEVRSDMVSVRSSILTAGQADVSQFATVQMGTNYPPRIFAVNPPPASGTIQTSDSYDIVITNGSDTETISTRFIQYRNGYNNLEVGSMWYENSILYLDETQDGGRVIYEDQQLVTDGNTLRITALQNEFDQSGTGRATLELYPTEAVTADDIPTGDVDITVPTRLTADQYWGDAMQGQSFYDGVTEDDYETGIHGLEFSIDTTQDSNELQVNTVGIRSEPDEGPAKQNVGSGSNDDSTTPPSDGVRGFTSVNAGNLNKNDSPDNQFFTFTVNQTLPDGETVTINLDDTQNANPFVSDDIDYSSASLQNNDASFDRGYAAVSIIYTADGDIPAGTQIEIEVTNVRYPNGNLDTFSVSFERSDGTTEVDTFSDG